MVIPTIKFKTIGSLKGLKSTNDINRLSIEGLNLTNTSNKDFTFREELEIGRIEINTFKDEVGLLKESAFEEESTDEEYLVEKYLSMMKQSVKYYSNHVHNFCFISWLIKDNSINHSTIYNFAYSDSDFLYCQSEMKIDHFTTCRGSYAQTNWSFEELKEITHMVNFCEALFTKEQLLTTEEIKDGYHLDNRTKRYQQNNRIERALNFIYIARTTSFLPAKLSSYMSMLESLVITDNKQATKQVITRVPRLINKYSKNLKGSRTQLNKIYDARSYFVHGSNFKDDHFKSIEKYCEYADNLCRELLLLILKDLSISSKFLNEDELKLLFESLD